MEQNNHTYPKFEAGQVLTSKAMNSYFGYLDEQERLTRVQLLGVGIINGLEFYYKDNAITITKGIAVTADGYLIELPKDTTYTLAYEYDKNSDMLAKQNPLNETDDKEFNEVLSHIKYVLYENESDASKHNQYLPKSTNIPEDLRKYIISLMVDFVSQDTITQCNELSCDIVQSNFQIEIRPVLIKKKDYNELATFLINFRFFNTYGNISNNLTINSTEITSIKDSIKTEFNSLKAFIKVHLDLFKDHIKEEITPTFPGIHQGTFSGTFSGTHQVTFSGTFSRPYPGQPVLIHERKSFIQDKKKEGLTMTMLNPTWILLLDNNPSLIGYPHSPFIHPFLDRLSEFSNKIEQLGEGMDSIPDYYILHLQNIILAMEEFVTYYNIFVGKYKMLPISKTTNSRLVMLGNGSNSFHNLFRQYHDRIINSKQFSDDRSLLQKFLCRILLLSENFLDDPTINQTIQCSRRKPHAKLGEYYIPNYYSFNEDLVRNWNAHSLFDVSHFDEETSYDLLFKPNSGFPRTIESTDLLVVDGYYGQNVDTVKSEIEKYIQENNLQIIVETIECTTNSSGSNGGGGLWHNNQWFLNQRPKNSEELMNIINQHLISKEEKFDIRDYFTDNNYFEKNHLSDQDTMIGKEALDRVNLLINNYKTINQAKTLTTRKKGTTKSGITQKGGNELTLTQEDYNDLETLRLVLISLLDKPQINQMIGCCTYDGKLVLIHSDKQVLLCVGSTKDLQI